MDNDQEHTQAAPPPQNQWAQAASVDSPHDIGEAPVQNEEAPAESTSDESPDEEAAAIAKHWEAEASDKEPSSFSWQASEFIHHQKEVGWYTAFGIIVLVLVGAMIFFHRWFEAAVFVMAAIALLVYAKKEPRVLQYIIDDHGVTIENKLYKYDKFRSFSVFSDVAWHSIDLDPTQRFQPRLTLIFESKDLDQILAILVQHLARIDRQPDLIERATRTLKF